MSGLDKHLMNEWRRLEEELVSMKDSVDLSELRVLQTSWRITVETIKDLVAV